MNAHEFLRALHHRLAPRTYLEIGVAQGSSLALSRCRSIGVDPAFQVDVQLTAPTSLIRETSEAYFAALERKGLTPFGRLPIDFAYIDGMHHLENVVADFIAIERYSAPSSVIGVDDVLPPSVEEAARDRLTQSWTGDVFWMAPVLAAYRPDLDALTVATEPAGTLLVTGLDPSSGVLAERLEDIVHEYVRADPQPVPEELLQRTDALPPEEVLALELWDEVRAAREELVNAPTFPRSGLSLDRGS
jgi:hypothetical protein